MWQWHPKSLKCKVFRSNFFSLDSNIEVSTWCIKHTSKWKATYFTSFSTATKFNGIKNILLYLRIDGKLQLKNLTMSGRSTWKMFLKSTFKKNLSKHHEMTTFVHSELCWNAAMRRKNGNLFRSILQRSSHPFNFNYSLYCAKAFLSCLFFCLLFHLPPKPHFNFTSFNLNFLLSRKICTCCTV